MWQLRTLLISLILSITLLCHQSNVCCYADVILEPEEIVPNFGDGYCSWCSIQSLANHHHISQLYNIAYNRIDDPDPGWMRRWSWKSGRWENIYRTRNSGWDDLIEAKVKSLGAKYKIQYSDNYSTDILEEAMKKNLGCVIGLYSGYPTTEVGAGHAVILAQFDAEKYSYYDTNEQYKYFQGDRIYFRNVWTGFALIIYK